MSESAVQNAMEVENKMRLALVSGLSHISRLIPYLEYREMQAKKYYHPDCPAEAKEELLKAVEHTNKEIKTILGL